MEDVDVVAVPGKAVDLVALARRVGIAVGRHHDAERGAAIPLGLDLAERAVDGMVDEREEVALEAHEDRLRLGITEAAVELHHARRAVLADHEARVKEARVGNSLGRHALHDRVDDLAHHAMMDFGRHHRRGRIRAHAAGVGALVAVEDALVVLARGERQHALAVDHHDEARLLALHEFLDDDAMAGVAELVAGEHHVDRRMRLVDRRRDHHALSGGEPVGLDHDRRAVLHHVGVRRFRVGEGRIARRRDVVPRHEALGEILRRLELRGHLRRPVDAKPLVAERVHDARGERPFGTDDRGVDAAFLRVAHQLRDRGEVEVHAAFLARGAGVAGRDEDA